MDIFVNGQKRFYQNKITLLELVQDLKIEDKVMASAVNMEIVKKESWRDFKLKDGDKVELLHFVGGG
jgi:sulfur carrier protein